MLLFPWGLIGKAILKRLLNNPELKRRIIDGLRKEAKETDSKIDDSMVDGFEAAWEVIVPILVGKL